MDDFLFVGLLFDGVVKENTVDWLAKFLSIDSLLTEANVYSFHVSVEGGIEESPVCPSVCAIGSDPNIPYEETVEV